MNDISTLTDQQYAKLLQPVWDFLCPQSNLTGRYDSIFVMGGTDLSVPRRAAELWHGKWAEPVLVTGGKGKLNSHSNRAEAEIFLDILTQSGVSRQSIFLETEASNSGENVRFGVKRLHEVGIHPKRILAVCKPFIARRCIATFNLQFPTIEVHTAPPVGDILQFQDRSREEFSIRLALEVRRLQTYPAQGFTAVTEIPAEVLRAVDQILKLCT